MSREMEDRLRAAYQAKAEQVTDRRLAQLRAERDSQLATLLSEDVPIARLEHPVQLDSRRHRHSRWFAPAVAAAAVAAVAAAAFALSSPGPHRNVPAPPASHLSSPTAPASPSVTSSPSATAGSSTSAAPAYLPAGQTGARDDVPWSAVGTGWRLVQPDLDGAQKSTFYLYDPAGGRYLISDQLPALAILQAWSPDGQRAMFETAEYQSRNNRFQELDLHSGQLSTGFTQYQGQFISYTQPRGLAVVVAGWVQDTDRLLRYGTDGTLQLAYPPTIAGQWLANSYPILYTPDGSQLVLQAGRNVVLLSNDGHLVQGYGLPGSNQLNCRPVKWWTPGTFLEACERSGGTAGLETSLYLQPAAGGTPTPLVPQSDQSYDHAWPLSNGDVLLGDGVGCGKTHLDVLHPDGTIVGFNWPAGVPDPSQFLSLSGDLATFEIVKSGQGCGSNGSANGLVDYNMITGATHVLTGSLGIVIGYPGS